MTDDRREHTDGQHRAAGHRALREDLGAYVLGALDREERLEVEQHLDTCTVCRDEVARLSALPRLLDRLSSQEATTGLQRPPAGMLDDVLRRIDRERRRDRGVLRVWQAAAAGLAAAIALVVWAPWQAPASPPPLVAAAQPVAAAVEGQAELLSRAWGTSVHLDVVGLPDRDAYVLWAVAVDGRREQAATWGPTGGSARVTGASAILRDTLERVEVTDSSGEVLAVFDLDAT